MATRLTFLLDARDGASRVLDRIGDHANRLGRRMLIASIEGDRAMRQLGRSTTQRMAGLQRDTDIGAKATEALKGALISLAPAAIPMAASIAPIAPAVGAAAVATAAYAAALGPQISAMTEAAEAEKKYTDAVDKSGARSQEAVAAHMEYVQAMDDLPPATRRAAAALSVLKDEYGDWSDSLAKDTMGPVVKGMALFTGLLPKTSGLVRGTSRELDRLMTIAGGAMESPGLDRTMGKLEKFSTGILRRANDGLVNFMRTADTGKVGGGISEFMDYARAQGPMVANTLRSVGEALVHVLTASSDVGVSALQVVNALAGIVAAIPPGAITMLIQLAIAIKVVKLAAVGMVAARNAVAAFGTSLVAMQAAAAAAPGRLAAVTAAVGTLSRGVKLAMAGTGIGLLVIALSELSQGGKEAAPDVDKLTAALARFGSSGKLSGEAAAVLGKDLGELKKQLNEVLNPSWAESFNNWGSNLTDGFLAPGDATENLTSSLDAVDDSLASLVSSGKADIAAAALKNLLKGMNPEQVDKIKGSLGDYKDALANADLEQKLAAQSLGLFGAQAQEVRKKLDEQKASADGLRQAIQALNDVNRQGLGGMIAFEAAIDSATKAAKDNAGALTMTGGQLDLNSEKSRNAATALNDLAARTDEAAASARESGASWSTVNGIYSRGRDKLVASAQAMGLTRSEAKALADQILATPDKTAKLKGNLEDLEGKLATAKSKLKSLPDSRQAKVKAEISDLQNKIRQATAALDAVNGKTATTHIRTVYSPAGHAGPGGIPKYAKGGRPEAGWALVGEEGPELVRFKGGEEVFDHKTSLRMSSGLDGHRSTAGAGLDAGRGLIAGLGASAAGVDSAARRMAAAVTAGVRAELEIASPSKKMKALMKDVGKGLIVGMTGEKPKIAATAKDLVKDIWAAWKGVKTNKDSQLVALVNKDTKKLQSLATKRDKVAATIAAANKYRNELYHDAQADAGLSSLGLQDEEVSASSIQAGLQQKLAKVDQFTRYVASLAKKGLNKNLIKQVLAMGPDQGYAYASALAGMSSAALKAVNSTQSQLDKAALNLGGLGADVMYDSGRNSGKGYLAGLQSQQKAIEAQMLKIAKGMDKAIRKALGIKSPSRVMAQLGRYTTEGLAVGMRERLPVLDGALAAVSGRVAATRPVISRAAVAGAGAGGVVYNIPITIEQAMDPVAVGRELQKVLVKFGRAQGATVQLKVG
ncbi:hypothetical protein AB0K57_04815 [Streptomyces halstedii]|uniref:hypothetical protein n=1 Tax=Streptomyces halstedii TaxID=1944 RepID=UPI00345FB5C3